VLDLYRDRVRFGFATYDGWDTYMGATPTVELSQFQFGMSGGLQGSWSYSPMAVSGWPIARADGRFIGSLWYPGCTSPYCIDSGVRGPEAEQGPLLIASDPARAQETNDRVQVELRGVRPYGGTPIASSLDDLYYFFKSDPDTAIDRRLPESRLSRRRLRLRAFAPGRSAGLRRGSRR